MSSNSKEELPPQYITCLACGSVGAGSAGAVSAIVVIEGVQAYNKEDGHTSSQNLEARGVSRQSCGAG